MGAESFVAFLGTVDPPGVRSADFLQKAAEVFQTNGASFLGAPSVRRVGIAHRQIEIQLDLVGADIA